ncbi:metal ABC transporter substrate-binding protein [Corynebacterium sp. 335C]
MRPISLIRSTAALAAAAALSFGAVACASDEGTDAAKGGNGGETVEVFATTGYLGDAVKNIAPDADVHVMVGPGGDPHTYQPTTEDIEMISDADAVIWNGLHLEAQMIDLLREQGDRQLEAGSKIPEDKLLPWPETGENGEALFDPHVWNSTDNWKLVVDAIVEHMVKVDPDNADTYEKNGEEYNAEIDEAAGYVTEKLSAIPDDKRYLVTGHDAFNYLGRDFNLEVMATDFVTSESEMTQEQINELADFIAKHKIPVIFQDNLKNPQAVTSLKELVKEKGHEVEVSDQPLYADSLGESAPTDTYIGVLKHNADTIAGALGK